MDSNTLLCIDDLPQVLELRKATLESQGYSVKLASNGLDAIRTLEETSVAAVLLEYKLEGMDAEAIACHIKQRFPDLPIPLPTAYVESLIIGSYYNSTGRGHGPNYLLGQRSQMGWWYYFPVAVGLKTPLAELIAGVERRA